MSHTSWSHTCIIYDIDNDVIKLPWLNRYDIHQYGYYKFLIENNFSWSPGVRYNETPL